MLELFFNNLAQVIGLVLFVIFLFILGREFFLWYFRINQNIENQKRILFLLEKLTQKRTNPKENKVTQSSPLYSTELQNTSNSLKLDQDIQKFCCQCGELITSKYPIIASEHGKTKYFCSENCRINSLEL